MVEVPRGVGEPGARATPVGMKSHRRPRTKVLRVAQIVSGGATVDVRLRDLSTTGMMIEGLPPAYIVGGAAVGIRLGVDPPLRGYIRWEREGRVGIAFATPLPDDHPWLEVARDEAQPHHRSA